MRVKRLHLRAVCTLQTPHYMSITCMCTHSMGILYLESIFGADSPSGLQDTEAREKKYALADSAFETHVASV
jgi:hypothetical protein